MKEYKLVSYDGNIQEGGTQVDSTVQAGNVFKSFGSGTGDVSAGEVGGTITGGNLGNFGGNIDTINEQVGNAGGIGDPQNSALPKKIGLWGKVKNFLFQEIDLNKQVVLELTPKEKKVLKEVHDFWFQEIQFTELHDFLFQEITIFGKKK